MTASWKPALGSAALALTLLACSTDTGPALPGSGGGTTGPWTEACPSNEAEHRTLDVGEVKLHVACRGDGPTIMLLHGFPEFWYGWDQVMDELSGSHRLIVPDQRGYNISDKPDGVPNYVIDKLVGDIVNLIDEVSSGPVVLVAHDWGGIVAWGLASLHPEKLSKLVILNAPHPNVFAREIANNPDQQMASSYITFFQSPTAESALSANDYALLASAFDGVLSEAELALYREAWAQPGALTGSLNYYRANFDGLNPKFSEKLNITVPTLVLWGLKDTALLAGNLDGLDEYVDDLEVKTFDDATHWIAHEKAAEVAAAITAFVND